VRRASKPFSGCKDVGGAFGAAGENRDGATVDRARRQRAARTASTNWSGPCSRQRSRTSSILPGDVRAQVDGGQRRPQLIEATWPGTAAALWLSASECSSPAGLACEQSEVVTEAGAGAELAVPPLVMRDLHAAVIDRDLPRALNAREMSAKR
jgi:hypothetical protein